ncbi:DUF1090 domain-containing protein [Scandinavium sp. V105_16]|uniref:DUF1090 domain-containing protein n=1 Tax=Scandinavium lactucae TaxID=3095028 RepID=A0AAJ2VQV0_9ENTR|nr:MULTISPECIES: DUF1090 domain-containing protein [unclassified Scandinavium]MDX6018819.1 DUF1090 domain-containing protein [Scandinavium sp. V105_16]MDX6030220.1 DUF1090 domain-containing protein [Scandinavium sp. V105_12]MDX6039114.1 DUF1090 domain-containing protein [Scandinavium sp. V105_6]MDX6050185.1 DUF1090 domain-containing protein [Scandinavium sp. V105_1]
MKRNMTFALLLLALPATSAFAAAGLTGCAAKKADIEQQIDYAKAHNNSYRVAGLEKALAEVTANCTDASLRADREADVRKKEQKVAEREQELNEAKASGRADKIEKKQEKLNDAKDELAQAKDELNK